MDETLNVLLVSDPILEVEADKFTTESGYKDFISSNVEWFSKKKNNIERQRLLDETAGTGYCIYNSDEAGSS